MPERYAIAQVTPHPWEDEHEVNAFVAALSQQLAERGHRVLVLAPSRSTALVRESRRLIRSARENPDALFDPDGGVRVLGVGELLPLHRRGGAPAPPVDIGRTIEEVLTRAPLDFVHVHEPFAPSASSVALRHSRALNVGSFHAPTERALSTQVARRFVELFFGRLDARTAAFGATQELMERYFPASYRRLSPGAEVLERPPYDGPVRFAFCAQEERQALRLFLRALRRLPDDVDWQATVFSPTGAAPTGALRSRVRDRVRVVTAAEATEDEVLAAADVVTLHLPATPQTIGLLSDREFALMKPGAVLINTARGNIVDTAALVRALSDGRLAAAGLDVLPEEPAIREEAEIFRAEAAPEAYNLKALVANHVLLRFPNVIVTPHNAYNTDAAISRIIETTLGNIEAFIRGEPRNVVAGS